MLFTAKPYFYNVIDDITEEEYQKASDIAKKKIEQYKKIVSNYDEWKRLTKSYNKFVSNKYYRTDTSRFNWHKEVDAFNKRCESFDFNDRNQIITAAYPDSFYNDDKLYYPIDYPQIFRVALALKTVNQVFKTEDDAIKYLQDLPETCLLGATDEDHIEWKEISNNISEFFNKYNNGILFISNGVD